MARPEYDGPRVRYDGVMAPFAALPGFGIPVAIGLLMFLLSVRNDRERTEVPAQARGGLHVLAISHGAYTVLLAAAVGIGLL